MSAFGLFETVFGTAVACVDDAGALTYLTFAPEREVPRAEARGLCRDDGAVAHVAAQVAAYGAGERQDFDLRLSTHGSEFQEAVWRALCDIPMGRTKSYGDIARAIGQPVIASRDVGQACGANPIMLVIPCHRVIGADGSLVGFGGGLELKARMLQFERRLAGVQRELF